MNRAFSPFLLVVGRIWGVAPGWYGAGLWPWGRRAERGFQPSMLRGRAFEVEGEEFFEELVVGESGVPVVGGEDGGVEAAVG